MHSGQPVHAHVIRCAAREQDRGRTMALASNTSLTRAHPPPHPSTQPYGVTITTPTKLGYADGGWLEQWYLYVPAVVNLNV